MNSVSISENKGVRLLHFGTTQWVQGGMRINSPEALLFDYAKQMMAWLLLPPMLPNDPDNLSSIKESSLHIVQLGIGAGSLTKFCLRYLPKSMINAVDICPQTIQTAHTFFKLPYENKRFQIHTCDAKDWVKNCDTKVDVIQMDMYDKDAIAPIHGTKAFFQQCAQVLKPKGWFVVNLFSRPSPSIRPNGSKEEYHPSFQENVRALREVFNTCLCLPAQKEGNMIFFASHQNLSQQDINFLQQSQVSAAQMWQYYAKLGISKWANSFTFAPTL